MKKQFLFSVLTIFSLMVVSCKKEKIETSEPSGPEEITIKSPFGGGSTLTKNLECLFKFNGNLADAMGKLPDGVPNINGALTFTEDRKGNPNSAIRFTGRYGVDISNIPYGTSKSVAAWVKYGGTVAPPAVSYFLKTYEPSPNICQDADKYVAVISGDTSLAAVQSNPLDGNWHFLVATYDGTTLKYYVDGNYIGSVLNINSSVYPPGFTSTYHVGYFPALNDNTVVISAWNGSMDDLRYYSRVLSASEVTKLANL